MTVHTIGGSNDGPLVVTERELARPTGTVSAEVAAALLHTTPATVRLWAERFGYPVPAHAEDGPRRYSYATVVALRDALCSGTSIASAVAVAMRTAPA